MKSPLRTLCITAAFLLLTSCTRTHSLGESMLVVLPEDSGVTETVMALGPVTVANPVQPVVTSSEKNSGTIVHATGIKKLGTSQQKLLSEFMSLYYSSLADLNMKDPSSLFALDAKTQAVKNRIVWESIVEIRSMQGPDLTLTGYSYRLTIQNIKKNEDGDIEIHAREDFIQNFSAYSGVDSRGYNVTHLFTLTDTEDGWRLKAHRQMDSLNNILLARIQKDGKTAEPGVALVKERKEELLKEARRNVSRRKTRGKSAENISFDNEYNSTAAVAYARQGVGRRRNGWPSFDRSGGNCQNFVSQCLYAGGVPMDSEKPGQWKCYGARLNTTYQPNGRSASWASVSNFLAYIQENEGFGLVAHADALYYTGEPGDILHMRTNDGWRHTVMITKTMKNNSGIVADYLIASNTMDLIDFPASAYHYTDQMLIKVYGWND